MKNILFLISCCSLFVISEVKSQSYAEEDISFFETNLICGAAPDIGCGTRAKPLLKKFIDHEAVEAAYLNHAGTVVGVVWKKDAENTIAIADAIFAEDDRSFTEVTGDVRIEQLKDFKQSKWYLGDEVDQLSMIEANRIATQLTSWIDGESDFSGEDKEKLHEAFESYIKKEFLAIEDASVIDQPSYWQRWEQELAEIGQAVLGDRMPELKLFSAGDNASGDNAKSCCTSKSANTACCTKTTTSACCTKANFSACCTKSN